MRRISFSPFGKENKTRNCCINGCRDVFPELLFTHCFMNSLAISVLFSWVWHQMSPGPSVDFDGSISLPAAIPRAFICLSLTTVCLTDRLTAHSHSQASSQPCSSHSKKQPHIPNSLTTTISAGGFVKQPPPCLHAHSVCNLCGMRTYTWACPFNLLVRRAAGPPSSPFMSWTGVIHVWAIHHPSADIG